MSLRHANRVDFIGLLAALAQLVYHGTFRRGLIHLGQLSASAGCEAEGFAFTTALQARELT